MLHSQNVAYLEDVVRRYLSDPASVEPSLRAWLEGPGREFVDPVAPADGPQQAPASIFAPRGVAAQAEASPAVDVLKAQARISQLINAYRVRGHLQASLDPLGFAKPIAHPELDPASWGLGPADYERTFSTAPLYGPSTMTLRELLAWLRDTYSRTVGCEFMHIHDVEVKRWLQERFETTRNRTEFDHENGVLVYTELCRAEAFEDFIHTKFRGAKRFSLEGGESLLPLLVIILEESGRFGVRDAVFGMAHRGRLNVLANILKKDPAKIFSEFQDSNPEAMIGRGDVKYHLGYCSEYVTRQGDSIELELTFNPSHLEVINPVVEGKVRAKQDRLGAGGDKAVLPILIHGDAAFAGQGLVVETLNMTALDGFKTGGTIHVVINNQIGFTTEPRDARSGHYCTEVAKVIQAPIIHVNGEDPEAVAHVARLAAEFRQRFQSDIIIDLFCYRKYGHNEGDEPTFTQPLMYKVIAGHPSVRETYKRSLVERKLVTEEETDAIDSHYRGRLEAELEASKGTVKQPHDPRVGRWEAYDGGPDAQVPEVPTLISDATYDAVIHRMTTVPVDFQVNPKVQRILDRRLDALKPDVAIDWGLGELLAYGSLVVGGHHVRITGQDVIRGTFTHRHAGLFDAETNALWKPFDHFGGDQGRFSIYNSHLSEAAVLGFEYGYALEEPDALVIWEAQFGDFVNGAQVVIDQFISASEDKWNRLSAITMLLPHGFEGQGPEHSSARLERFLQLCAEDNMQVCNLTTPAQIFHALRRQVVRTWRKPLIIMSPKSLLRHKLAVSLREDFTHGAFQRVIRDVADLDDKLVERVVLCTGKVYYDLAERRDLLAADAVSTTAVIRLEQLYPFPKDLVLAEVKRYPALKEVVWCQEEPKNMGAYNFLYPRLTAALASGPALRWVGRTESASPATGSPRAHAIEQKRLVDEVFGA